MNVNLKVNNANIREETLEGRDYVVSPVVMMVEGVHVGSGGPVFYSEAELSAFPDAWNGEPVVLFHPETEEGHVSANSPQILEEYKIGQLFNTVFENGKLKSEVWIDVLKANALDTNILTQVRAGTPMDVSIGAYSENEVTTGDWNGETYQAIARNIRPDHLALLPGGEGACNWRDGCGLRTNSANKDPKKYLANSLSDVAKFSKPAEEKKQGPIEILTNLLKKALDIEITPDLQVNEVSHDDTRMLLQRYVDTLDANGTWHYVRYVYDNYFVYVAENNRAQPGEEPYTLYKRNYNVDNQDKLTVSEDVVKVRENREFIVVNNEKQEKVSTNEQKGEDMDPKKRKSVIAAMTSCKDCRWTPDDAEFLNGLTDNQLEKVADGVVSNEDEQPVTPAVEKTDAEKLADAVGVTPEPVTSAAKPVAWDEALKSAPQPVQDMVANGIRLANQEKSKAIQTIMGARGNVFTDKELQGKELPELQSMAKLVAPAVDYSGRAGGAPPVTNSSVKPMDDPYEK